MITLQLKLWMICLNVFDLDQKRRIIAAACLSVCVMQSIGLILQLLLCLSLGFLSSHYLPQIFKQYAFKLLPYCSYLILVAIAIEFSQVLNSISNPWTLLIPAMTLSFSTSIGAFVCCYLLFKGLNTHPSHGKVDLSLLLSSLLNIGYAVFALVAGVILAYALQSFEIKLVINSWWLLLGFMLLIGIDLAEHPLDRSWINWKILCVPLGCVIGSCLGAYFSYVVLKDLSFMDALLFSQGYGFYSMSSIVISELKGPELGSIALMNDLLREIFAILLMYALGWRYPRSAIAAAGATAMDVTLPMVKQACGNAFIPHAMLSGFILSILAPIVVSVLAAL